MLDDGTSAGGTLGADIEGRLQAIGAFVTNASAVLAVAEMIKALMFLQGTLPADLHCLEYLFGIRQVRRPDSVRRLTCE